jgi:hypothetical protein
MTRVIQINDQKEKLGMVYYGPEHAIIEREDGVLLVFDKDYIKKMPLVDLKQLIEKINNAPNYSRMVPGDGSVELFWRPKGLLVTAPMSSNYHAEKDMWIVQEDGAMDYDSGMYRGHFETLAEALQYLVQGEIK